VPRIMLCWCHPLHRCRDGDRVLSQLHQRCLAAMKSMSACEALYLHDTRARLRLNISPSRVSYCAVAGRSCHLACLAIAVLRCFAAAHAQRLYGRLARTTEPGWRASYALRTFALGFVATS